MKKFLSIAITACLFAVFSVTTTAFSFSDVDLNAWYAESVQYMQDHGLMNGVGDNRFDPNGTVTRGMLVTILYRLDNTDEDVQGVPFGDVSANSYYAKPVAWAAKHGIINGYSQSRFDPNDSVTREQIATILYRYSAFKGYDVTKESALASYTDSGTISQYALKAMRWAEATGIIKGISNSQLGPKLTASRAQVATMVMRFDRAIRSEPAERESTEDAPAVSTPSQEATLDQDTGSSTEDKQVFALEVDHVAAKAGSKDVTVTISVNNNPGILGMILSVRYNDSILSLKGAENGEAVSDVLSLTNPGKFQSTCRFMWDSVEIAPENVKDGAVLKLHFEIPKDAPAERYPIEIFYNSSDIVDNNLCILSPEINNGSITVTE